MDMKKFVLISALALLLAPLLCNSAFAQKKYAEEMRAASVVQAEWYERSLPLLSKKIPAHPKQTTLAQFADPSKADKAEKDELHILVEKRKEYLWQVVVIILENPRRLLLRRTNLAKKHEQKI